jgi:gamma-glutamyltranspeptidase/glutathione hydrolase
MDAAVAGCLVQAVVQQDMTNHAGTVTALVYESATGQVHELNSSGTIVPGLAPFVRVPPGRGYYTGIPGAPFAVVPGFMPGIKALHERFGTRSWSELCEPAVRWATAGHEVGSFEHLVTAQTVDLFLYTESGRAHFAPGGHLPQVGDTWRSPELAETMAAVASEGPDHMITGAWAQAFVARANSIGWPVTLDELSRPEPRWGSGFRWSHRGNEVVQLSPPERQGVYCAIVMGMLDALGVQERGPASEDPMSLWFLAHALRRAHLETGFINDPHVFDDPSEVLASPELIGRFAETLRQALPKADLTSHTQLVRGRTRMAAGGQQPAGSCELSLVDSHGNWVQMMNTLQGGGIPGEVVGGVPMVGSHAVPGLNRYMAGWFTGGGRSRCVLTNTFVMRDGRPWLALGTPGSAHCTVPQVLSGILDHGLDPYAADDAPRCLPYENDHTISVESRLGPGVADGLASMGVLVNPLARYDFQMGTFQTSWRDEENVLHACTGPRRAGKAAAL